MTALGDLMTEDDEEGRPDESLRVPDDGRDIEAPKTTGPPDRCVSAITVGQTIYWCEAGKAGHDGLCTGTDPWGGRAEWRWALER